MYTTTFLGLGRRSEDEPRRGSFGLSRIGSYIGMNHLQLNDRGGIQLIDASMERFHAISQTFVSGRRVRIQIREELFETFEETLMRFPDTLLGSRRKRRHYVPEKNAYVFKGRDQFAFNAILFFYQSGGILSRPSDVPFKIFARELQFFELTDYCADCWTLKTIPVQVPRQPCAQTLWLLFEDPQASWAAWIVSWISLFAIAVITALFCYETTEEGNLLLCEQQNETIPVDRAAFCHQTVTWFTIDSIIIAWFLLEYLARLITAPDKFRFIFSFLGVIDFLSLVPYFSILILETHNQGFPEERQGVDTFLRLLRLLRVVRVLKLAHHIEALRLLGYTILQCLYLLVGLILLVAIITISLASSIYLTEKFNPAAQIDDPLDAAWFVVITLTNVGYGDVVPQTGFGKVLGSLACMLSILVVFILPAPVLLNHFEEIYSLRKERRDRNKKSDSIPDQLDD